MAPVAGVIVDRVGRRAAILVRQRVPGSWARCSWNFPTGRTSTWPSWTCPSSPIAAAEGTAADNTPMREVNLRFGFRQVERMVEFQRAR
jgi:hypothetical protein